jgi:hypothetical protein
MVLCVLTGWLDRREREAVAHLIEENRRRLGGLLNFYERGGAIVESAKNWNITSLAS